MEIETVQVMLIIPEGDENLTLLKELYTRKGYRFVHAAHMDGAIRAFTDSIPDLIISSWQVQQLTGFRIYEAFRSSLLKFGIPFFLLMDHFRKEDIMLGLEMGIDNFVFSPIDEMSLINKTERHLAKINRNNMLTSEHFRSVFELNPTARIILRRTQIIRMNRAFTMLTGILELPVDPIFFNDVFMLVEEGSNSLDFQRCMNGLIPCCLLRSVSLRSNAESVFDIQIISKDLVRENIFVVDVIPVKSLFSQGNQKLRNEVQCSFRNGVVLRKLLTKREEEILMMSCMGLPIKQIAQELEISDRTVEKHRTNIMHKTHTNSIIEAIYTLQINPL